MQPEELFRILYQQPFQPFRVHLKDGRSYDVIHESLAVVASTYFHIGVCSPNHSDTICDYVAMVDLPEITRVEQLPASAPRD